tara:strand:+ start:1430 stop:2401 length:972 start_codon:yes stop_codon:yes gene_type:complete
MGDVIEYTKSNSTLFKELLEIESDEEYDSNEIKVCLITMLPLDASYIALECGHTFNYDPLFKDVYNHKKVFTRLESTKLKPHELRCPYCRNIQGKLLPVNTGIPLIYGVNSLNAKTEKMSKRMNNIHCYYQIFHTYTNGMCCNGMNKHNVLHSGFSETTVTCQNKKVMYNNLNGLVYCADHNNEIMCNIFDKEIIRLNQLIEKYKTIMETTKGPKKQAAKKKVNSFTLVCNNITDVKTEIVVSYDQAKIEMTAVKNSDEMSSDDDWETPYDYTNKYSQKCRCFAYYTSGAKKDTRCVNVGGYGVGNELYCAKHPYIFEKIEDD